MKKVKTTYTIRPKTEKLLREYAKETELTMSHIVDIAIEHYIKMNTEYPSIWGKIKTPADVYKVHIKGKPKESKLQRK